MKLQDLIQKEFPEVADQCLSFSMQWKNSEVSGISSDSRCIQPGWIFVAIPGNKVDGRSFIAQALQRGAIAIVMPNSDVLQKFAELDYSGMPILFVDNIRKFLSIIASRLYGNHPDIIFAITGTSGKTSVASFVRQICQYAGFSAAQIGTTGIISSQYKDDNSLTTPDPVYLAQTLSRFSSQGVTHVSIEASSHGLDQHRLDAVQLSAGAFTNLGRDHLDYHETMQAYFKAKMRLFEELLPKGSPAIVFADDAWSDEVMIRARKSGCHVLSVGSKGTFVHLKKIVRRDDKQEITLSVEGETFNINFPLCGEFQVQNALVAAGLCIATGIDIAVVIKALETLGVVSGRLELVHRTVNGGRIYVDYAHNPSSLKSLLENVRIFTSGRIILVFGCGGERDQGKRLLMGQISLQLADVVIVTDDNPRSEDPQKIRSEIINGSDLFIEEGDRREAIRKAISMLRSDDVLVVAGKGHETIQIGSGNITVGFSDSGIICEILGY
ncbi:UDP-N-acetylmuramoyl-L-alanyl-D-glutamate--2,6-diaminopimelate ligase [Candidatus Liberibacter sp.]|uniref:UDP-N-acetylmuramoyl-L-alanyl-D-glutamate--2, 6-diaminopimelate ligase n=1 Tax=Candidatus Liberibacter sp. TaxID=34022 RepID=UPI0015F43BA2|nr:UDP-N-acetylmuramoyl-L-alanyl-D-glutamate--2,6-diaminopimelate ligase [Candidatus Liberibacter sp.]MBA5724059.1 UDP-N-acetylmuramoyl-L-alanyl-D-glutamate--2,6-diaminopimelate ligase [Candidatus Liberibacter sp.]